MDSTKPRRLRPRLERRNAVKNIDYEATDSPSSSSSFDYSLARGNGYVNLFPMSGGTSFRVEGVEGEFDRICRSLGLSVEDFAIPAAAWEANKVSVTSPSPRAQLRGSGFGDDVRIDDDLLDSFDARVSVSEELTSVDEPAEIDTAVSVGKAEDGVNDGNLSVDSISGCGIKGFRPPKMAPPPGVLRRAVDDVSSTWEIMKAFGPGDDEDIVSSANLDGFKQNNGINGRQMAGYDTRVVRPPKMAPPPAFLRRAVDDVSSTWNIMKAFGPGDDEDIVSSANLDGFKQNNGINGRQMAGYDTRVVSESCSDSSNDEIDGENNGDFVIAMMEPVYCISPNASFSRRIDSWQKGDFLGSGSFGTVYEGFTDDGFFFAVKEVSLLDQGSQGKQSILQLEQEISLLSQFQHENIVRYLGTKKDDSKLYIFLELVTKGSLQSLYQKYNLRDSQVSVYTRQILNGLNYLHRQNVVHRDIKCANILVDASGSVKLADFGLAKATKLNDIKSCKGTAFWMAPEVVNRKNNGYGLAADIWSFGCTVLEMLTGRIPYSHLEGMQALFRIGKGEPPPIPNSLSRDAQDFILKCLQVNPNDRLSAAQLLNHPFVRKPPSTFSSPVSPH